MTEVIPGIHLLKLSTAKTIFSLTEVNVYLVRGDRGYLLVDTGWNTDESFDSMQKQMAEIGVDIKDISQIVITHTHPDHYGQTGEIKRLSGATLAIHAIEKEYIDSTYAHMDKMLEQTDRWLAINGAPPGKLAEIKAITTGLQRHVFPINPDITFHGGETITTGIFNFQVLWTPGHAPGHICLYEPEKRVLISGDQILPTITPNISLTPRSGENPLATYLTSLNGLRGLDARLVLPGHENPFTGLKPRIDELIKHHAERNREILASFKGAPKTAYQIARVITWGDGTGWPGMTPYDQRLAILETLAHLEMMTANGQLEKLTKDGMISYRQT